MTEVKWSESCSVVSDSFWPHGLYSPRNSPGQSTGVGSLSLLQGIFPTQGLTPGLPHCGRILYKLSHKGSKWQRCCLNYDAASIVTVFPEQQGSSSERLPAFQVHAPWQDFSRGLRLPFPWETWALCEPCRGCWLTLQGLQMLPGLLPRLSTTTSRAGVGLYANFHPKHAACYSASRKLSKDTD